MKSLEEELQKTEETIKTQKQKYVDWGLQYFNEERRNTLLKKAEDANFSVETIKRIRSCGGEKWNQDTVDYNVIQDIRAAEDYTQEHTPGWEKSFLTSVGGLLNGRK